MTNKYFLRETALTLSLNEQSFAQGKLNALLRDHTDAALIEPLIKIYDVKVNQRAYEGTVATFAVLEQSHPGSWDVLVIDGSNVFQAVDAGLMAPLPANQMPIGHQLPEVVMSDNNASDDVMYAIAAKFGYNTISYNATKVDNADKNDMSKVWSDKYKDRIAICDCDLPVMGVAAMANGSETA